MKILVSIDYWCIRQYLSFPVSLVLSTKMNDAGSRTHCGKIFMYIISEYMSFSVCYRLHSPEHHFMIYVLCCSAFSVCMDEVMNTDVIISDNLTDESELRKGVVDDNLGFSVSWILGQH
jgi:hypothetical protein